MTVLFVSPLFVPDKDHISLYIRVTAVPALPFPCHPLGPWCRSQRPQLPSIGATVAAENRQGAQWRVAKEQARC